MLIKQGVATRPLIFLMVDSTDSITGKTGLSPTVTLSKNGGSFASPSGSVTEIGNGWYKVAGHATDTNTLGSLVLHASAAGADPVDLMYQIVAYDPDNANNMGMARLDAAVSTRSSHSASDVATSVWAAATRTLTEFAFLSASGLAWAVWEEDLSGHTTVGSAGEALGDLGDPWSTSLPGSYTAGQAGKIIGDRLDAAVSSRSTYTGADTSGTTTLLSRLPDTLTSSGIASQVLTQADGVESGVTLQQAARLILAALVGKLAGADTNTVTVRNVGDTKDRIVASVDADGNRLTITLDMD